MSPDGASVGIGRTELGAEAAHKTPEGCEKQHRYKEL